MSLNDMRSACLLIGNVQTRINNLYLQGRSRALDDGDMAWLDAVSLLLRYRIADANRVVNALKTYSKMAYRFLVVASSMEKLIDISFLNGTGVIKNEQFITDFIIGQSDTFQSTDYFKVINYMSPKVEAELTLPGLSSATLSDSGVSPDPINPVKVGFADILGYNGRCTLDVLAALANESPTNTLTHYRYITANSYYVIIRRLALDNGALNINIDFPYEMDYLHFSNIKIDAVTSIADVSIKGVVVLPLRGCATLSLSNRGKVYKLNSGAYFYGNLENNMLLNVRTWNSTLTSGEVFIIRISGDIAVSTSGLSRMFSGNFLHKMDENLGIDCADMIPTWNFGIGKICHNLIYTLTSNNGTALTALNSAFEHCIQVLCRRANPNAIYRSSSDFFNYSATVGGIYKTFF